MKAPREIGIPFGVPMVRAILRQVSPKTMTRRVARLNAAGRVQRGSRNWHTDDPDALLACPYGQPGDRLYVREPWRTEARYDHLSPTALPANARIWYLADGEPTAPDVGRYRHARFMPRRFTRIVLVVTNRRLERLGGISRADALAEGIEIIGGPACASPYRNYRKGAPGEMDMHCSCPRRSFMTLWESINGPGSWMENTLVWVVEFAPLAPVRSEHYG